MREQPQASVSLPRGQERRHKRKRLLWRFLLFLGVALAGLMVADQVLLPALIHARPTVRLPSVVGMPLSQAVELLVQQGFVVQEIRYEPNPSIPEGYVVRQVPYAGAEVRRGRRVYLTVSTGQRTVVMPAVVGLSYREAQIQLLSRGLRIGQIVSTYDDTMPAGAVVWQSIPAQQSVSVGTAIDLLISQGPRPSVLVPSLVGLSLEEAQEVLVRAGLRLGVVKVESDATFLPNTVIAQSPAADSVVAPGTGVSVTIAR